METKRRERSYIEYKKNANWFGHTFLRNCLLKHIIEGKKGRIEVTERQGRRRMQLPGDLKEVRLYLNLKEKALYRAMWRTRFGRKALWTCHMTEYEMNMNQC